MNYGQSPSDRRFMGWRDVTITPAVESVLLVAALLPTLALRARFGLGLIEAGLTFYLLLVAWTLVALWLIRGLFSHYFAAGVISPRRDPWRSYVAFNLYGFLLITNLTLQYNNTLLPPPFRSLFYRLLGARVGSGIVSIGGKVADAHMVRIGRDAVIGEEAFILGHGFNTVGGEDLVVFGEVSIGDGAVIGARAVVMPGVTIGNHAMIAAMSFVPMGTKIPPYEVWGGFPAKRISSRRPLVAVKQPATEAPTPAASVG